MQRQLWGKVTCCGNTTVLGRLGLRSACFQIYPGGHEGSHGRLSSRPAPLARTSPRLSQAGETTAHPHWPAPHSPSVVCPESLLRHHTPPGRWLPARGRPPSPCAHQQPSPGPGPGWAPGWQPGKGRGALRWHRPGHKLPDRGGQPVPLPVSHGFASCLIARFFVEVGPRVRQPHRRGTGRWGGDTPVLPGPGAGRGISIVPPDSRPVWERGGPCSCFTDEGAQTTVLRGSGVGGQQQGGRRLGRLLSPWDRPAC